MAETHTKQEQTELEKLLRSSKPWFEENGTLLIYALAGVLAVAAVFIYLNRSSSGDAAASKDLLLATKPEEYRDIADSYPDTQIGIWSRLRQADRLRDDAVTAMFTNREEGVSLLEQSDTAYQRLSERTGLSDQVRERVLIGLAQIAEVRCDGKDETTNAAIAAWKRVLNEYDDSIVKNYAEQRVSRLETEESKSFYAWFSEHNPTPVDPGLAPGQPAVPADPNASTPENGDVDGPNASSDDDGKTLNPSEQPVESATGDVGKPEESAESEPPKTGLKSDTEELPFDAQTAAKPERGQSSPAETANPEQSGAAPQASKETEE